MNDQNKEIAIRDQPLDITLGASVKSVLDQVKIIHGVLKEVMTEGEHFGVIPGCGNKPALFKAGAEKLNLTFHLCPEFEGEREPIQIGNGHREYIIKTKLVYFPTGTVMGHGVGSCSTMETKYRYRGGEGKRVKPVPKEYWAAKNHQPPDIQKMKEISGGLRAVKTDDGWYFCEAGERVENQDIADQYNTVLKMAKKRSMVDAILTVTAASDIFTQDIEEGVPHDEPKAAAPQDQPPTPKGEKFSMRAAIDNAVDGCDSSSAWDATLDGLKAAPWWSNRAQTYYDKCRAAWDGAQDREAGFLNNIETK